MRSELGSPNNSKAPSTMKSSSTISQDGGSVNSDTSSARASTITVSNASDSFASSRRSSTNAGFGPFTEPARNPFALDAADTLFAPIDWNSYRGSSVGSGPSSASGYSPRALAVDIFNNGSNNKPRLGDGSQVPSGSGVTADTRPGMMANLQPVRGQQSSERDH
ncbi:hypothetical protein PG991_001017 [Apiospora marii]|uniref:Uncharacterized protein n=1 Tax=Apiospora marii TaxID=335849 RepID=A0ABR1SUZ3_9PEZI